MTINILNVVLGKVDYANTNKTTFVPKNTVQTFNVTQKNDYTKITRDTIMLRIYRQNMPELMRKNIYLQQKITVQKHFV